MAIGSVVSGRGGVLTPGYRVTLTISSGGETVDVVVVTGSPEKTAGWMVDRLRRAGVAAEMGEPRIDCLGERVEAA